MYSKTPNNHKSPLHCGRDIDIICGYKVFFKFEKHVKDKCVAERLWLHIRKVVEEREGGGTTHAEKEIVVPTPLWLIFIG